MNPIDMIFGAVSSLTGGLIVDMTTACIGLLTLSFLAMGFDLLMSIFASSMHRKQSALSSRRSIEAAEFEVFGAAQDLKAQKAMADKTGDTVGLDMAKARYRSAVSRYGRLSSGGK